METQTLIELALDQIRRDVALGDFTAIEELLKVVPAQALQAFLSEAA